jgi:hypothetical protein
LICAALDVSFGARLNPSILLITAAKMELFRSLYDWNERTFWNSLTKKLMSFLLLFLIDIVYLAIYTHQKRLIADELARPAPARH